MEAFIKSIRRNPIQRIAAICYIIKDEKTLMIDRIKEPFKGFLVAPGGKQEEEEAIEDCIKREIIEETGLIIKNPELKVVTTEIGPENYNWILFIYVCRQFSGEVKESNEGKLTWIDIESLKDERLSKIDKEILPYVFSENKYIMYLKYDNNKNCTIESVEVINGDRESDI
jgi:8-oxo-dGTP diphosphatase